MIPFPTSAELKRRAKGQLIGHYSPAISAELMILVLMLLSSSICTRLIDDTTTFGFVVSIVVSLILEVLFSIFQIGLAKFYLDLVCGKECHAISIYSGFKSQADLAIITRAWIIVLELICLVPSIICCYIYSMTASALVFLISCVVLALSIILIIYVEIMYSQIYYIMADFPDKSAREVLATSRHIMRGHRLRYLYIQVSLIPYYLISVLSCGIALIWITAYRKAICTNFYLNLFENTKDTSSFNETV